MDKLRYHYYEEQGMYIGWMEHYPDYRTQGVSIAELESNLRDLYEDIHSGEIPGIIHTGELMVG